MSDGDLVPIFDGHNDALLRLRNHQDEGPRSFIDGVERGHLDLPRARAGGFAGGMFACFTPSPKGKKQRVVRTNAGYEESFPQTPDVAYAMEVTSGLAADLFRIEALSDGALRVARTAADIRECMSAGKVAATFHIEGAEAIDPDLNMLELLYKAGLRSIGPVWSRPNAFGYGVPFRFPSGPDIGPGLTETGKALVEACNRLGILIDLSHLNEKGFWDVHELTDAPLVATHSNAHQLCPVSRNLTDKQLHAIRESDGMVGLNYAVCFLRDDGENNADTPLETMLRHLDHLIEQTGEDRVGLGSDFDGAMIPKAIGTVAGQQNLIQAMRDHGYGQDLIEKVAYRNWLRVLEKTWGA
ncbi:MAG: dipeptidase [Pseudomonadota bacterium]